MSNVLAIPPLFEGEDTEELHEQLKQLEEYRRLKRRWENAFQRWSDKSSTEGTDSYGCCGFGAFCDCCDDNTYGRPCVRALNAWCRENGKSINYNDRNFEKIWRGEV